jgi:hypothetical protein
MLYYIYCMKRGLLLLLVLICCVSADSDKIQERNMLIRKAIVVDLYQIDISAGEWVDSFKILSVDTLSEKAFLNMWTERIQLAMMFTERRLALFNNNLKKSAKTGRFIDSIKTLRDEVAGYHAQQKVQLDSCKKVMKHAEKKKGFGYLANTYRMFKSPNGVFMKGDGQYLVTRDMQAEPYYKHNDTTRLLSDFVLETRRYIRSEVAE